MIKTAFIALLLAILPINPEIKVHISLVLSELLSPEFVKWVSTKLNWFNKKVVRINEVTEGTDDNNGHNKLYKKFQLYVTKKYSDKLTSCELVPRNGDIEFNIRDMIGESFIDIYNGHKINIKVRQDDKTRYIELTSDTASANIINNYSRIVMNKKLENKGFVQVYSPVIRGKKKDEQYVSWECVVMQTNKTINNTIYSKEIEEEMFGDIDKFMSREMQMEYGNLGIPYNRGYLVESPPGYGKTSIAKIIANKYSIPIFSLDLTIIEDNNTLKKLMTEMNYYVNHQKHILLMEDVDRSKFFSKYDRNPNITMDALLNAIDGVVETHGRLTFMFVNDSDPITACKALVRPGRIDNHIVVGPCDKDQIRRMCELFAHDRKIVDQIEWDNWDINEGLAPAYVIGLLRKHRSNIKMFIKLIATSANSDLDSDLDNNDEAKELIEAELKRQEEAKEETGNYSQKRRRYRYKGYKDGYSIKDKIHNIKNTIKRSTNYVARYQRSLTKAKNKLPNLVAKLEDMNKKKKLREATRKAKNKARKKRLRNMGVGKVEEEEYETPAFLLNTIEKGNVADDVIVTYELDNIDPEDCAELDSVQEWISLLNSTETTESKIDDGIGLGLRKRNV